MAEEDQELINNRFKIGRKVGNGSFGEVYQAFDTQTNEEVAIKIEINSEIQSQLQHEAKIMKMMQGLEGFPNMIWSGQDIKNREILALELLSFNLEGLLQRQNDKKMSLKTVLMVADQMLKRIESLHLKNFLYRDVKPENFLIGKGKLIGQIYLIDFGLVKKFRDSKTGKHIQYKDNKGLIGTARFVSINTHLGVGKIFLPINDFIEQSRRDDLESLAYVWIYLLKGKLPWSGIIGESKDDKYEKLKQKKIQTPLDILCEGLPDLFIQYITYCRQLKFEEQPDYCQLKQMFKECFFKLEFTWDYLYDWMLVQDEERILNNKQEYQQLIPNKCLSEDDIRGKKGSTTYESIKDNYKEESALKAIDSAVQFKLQNQESSGGIIQQIFQNPQTNLLSSIRSEEDLKQVKQNLFQNHMNVEKEKEYKEEINFKLITPQQNNAKRNLNQLKMNPNLFENLFKNE